MISIQKLRSMNLDSVADELEQLRKFEAETESQTAIAAQHRFRRPEKTMPDWSSWQPAEVDYNRPSYEIDSQGYEVEYRLLYESPIPTKQPARITEEMISRAMGVVIGSSGDYGTHNEYLSKDSAREVLEAALSTSEQVPAVAVYDLSPANVEGKIRDRLIAMGWTPPESSAVVVPDEIEVLRAEIENLRKDAERYRWITSEENWSEAVEYAICEDGRKPVIDAAIDEAIVGDLSNVRSN